MVGVSGPTAPKAAQIAGFMSFFVIGELNNPDLVAAFSIIFLSGLILVCISLLKISRFIHYTPYPVIAGFMCGIGVIVILTQLNAFVGFEASVAFRDFVENYSRQVSVEDILNSGDVEKTSEFTINEHCALIEKMEASDVFNNVLTELQISNLATYFVNLDSEPAMKLWAVIGKGERDNVINLHKAEASDGNKVGHRLVELLTGNNN